MNPGAPTPAPTSTPPEGPKPGNPEPTPAPADPEKQHVRDPQQGRSEHPTRQ